jgi:hypothetical protein
VSVIRWFKRLADVPNIGYPGHPTIKRDTLKDHDLEPTRSRWKDLDGKRQDSLMWMRGDTGSSQSPASSHHHEEHLNESTPQEILQRAFESFELPGTIGDYHWIFESTTRSLWDHRKSEPRVLKAIDQFCWQDVRLVEAYPKLYEEMDWDFVPQLACFDKLIELYEREGYWNDALELVRRAQVLTSHEHYTNKIFEITERLNNLTSDRG